MLRWFRNRTITTKITLLLSLTAFFFILTLAISGYYFARHKLLQTIETDQTSLVATLARQLDDKLKNSRNYLEHLAQHIQNHGSYADRPQEMLHHHDEAQLFFDAGILLLSPQGRIIAETPFHKDRIGLDRSTRDYFMQVVRTGRVVVSSPYRITLAPHQPVVALSMPLRDEQGRLSGVLVGRHSLNKGFLHELTNSKIGNTGYFYLFNQQRMLLVHPDQKRMLTAVPVGKNKVLETALQGWQGTRENVNSHGTPGLTSIHQLKEAPWYLAAHYPLQEAYAPLNQLHQLFGLLLVLAVIFVMIAVWVCAQPLIRPLRILSNHLQHLNEKRGDDRFLPVRSNDEIGQLTQVFNELLQELDDDAASREEVAQTQQVISEYMSEVAVWRDTDNAVRFISANCYQLTGYQDIEFYADPDLMEQLLHPADRTLWDSRHQVHGDEDSHPPFELRLIRKDGAIRWVRHVCHQTCDQQGVVTGRRGSFIDVTSLLEMQQSLQDEKLFIENMINSASTPLFVINASHQVLYWNRAMEIMSGCTQDTIRATDLHWSAFYTEKRATLADLVVSGYKLNLEAFYQTYTPSKYIAGGFQAEGWYELNGLRRYLVFEAAPIRNRDGEVIAAIETLEDITERRIMEESVRRLTSAVEQSASTIVITDIQGTIEYVNPRFCQTSGYTAEEALGQNPRLLKSGEISSDGYADLWQTISSGHVWRGELHNKRKDGTLYWEATSISPLFDKQGSITGYLAVKEDISEQKAARKQLEQFGEQLDQQHQELQLAFNKIEQAKQEWEQTLDHLQDFIILTDADHHIKRFNKILADMTGMPLASLAGHDWRDLLQNVGFKFVNFSGNTGELVHLRSARSYDISIYPVKDASGILQGFVVSLNDTTELRSTAQELEKTLGELNEAQSQIYQQEKMASIGQLAAGVAHEINNPMGFITSNLGSLDKYISRISEFISAVDQALQRCEAVELTIPVQETRKRLKIDRILDDAHQLIAESQDGAGRVRRIVQDLKSFSRVDQSETALIDLNESLETTINIAWNELKYIADVHREFGDIPKIKCFPQQLNQVFLNLLVNAAHALGETHGDITIRTEQDGKTVLVKVTDTGCGMSEEVQRRIFEPFFTTKEVGKGTGLGLSISYDIIKKHGGSIVVESEVGRGTTFIVRLPLEVVEEPV